MRNTATTYGWLAKLLHWGMAFLLIGLLALGLYMTALPDGDPKWAWYDLHKSLGALAFLLYLVRAVWRHLSPPPALPAGMSPAEQRLAHLGHHLLYLCMLALPITGYLDSSLGGYHLSFFGLFDVPMLLPKQPELGELVEEIHGWLGYALIALLLGHVGAALKHHFILKDDVLRRMTFR